MIESLDELNSLLEAVDLLDRSTVELDIPESLQKAFAIEINADNAIETWYVLRALLNHTQRWPLIVAPDIVASENWKDNIAAQQFFHRGEFKSEGFSQSEEDASPEIVISNALEIEDPVQELRDYYRNFTVPSDKDEVDSYVGNEIRRSCETYGIEISRVDVPNFDSFGCRGKIFELEKWLLQEEIKQVGLPEALKPRNIRPGYLNDCYLSGSLVLLLLPTPSSYESLAYVHWYGAQGYYSELAISLLDYWNTEFGAELVVHFGTVLHFFVEEQPSTIEEALDLARQHDLFSGNTLAGPGVSLRDHARALMQSDRWLLHDRP